VEERADLVGDGYAGLGGDADWDGLVLGERGEESGEEWNCVVLDGSGGEAVGDDYHDVARGRF